MKYWLMKTEPGCFGLHDLKARPKRTAPWDGVRNYQARNFLRDDMKKGDRAFFYHSSCAEPGIAGIVKIVRPGYPDRTAWDPDGEHFDPKSSPDNPIWYMVDVQLEREFRHPAALAALRQNPGLRDMLLLQRGSRLSVLPVTKQHWDAVLNMIRSR
jgi:predicted RNA-binding protein with PUA-like domain